MADSPLPADVPRDLLDTITEAAVGADKLVAATAWETPDLLNGWQQYETGYAPVSFSLEKDNHVMLRGRMKSGQLGLAVPAFFLPEGHRPLYITEHLVRCAGGMASIQVTPEGMVSIANAVTRVGEVVGILQSIDTTSSAPLEIREGLFALNGAALRRLDVPTLFKLTGTTYGVGNGSTTFNLPNFKGGRVCVAAGAAPNGTPYNIGSQGGEEKHTPTLEEMFRHQHTNSKIIETGGGGSGHSHGPGDQSAINGPGPGLRAKGRPTVNEASGYGLTQTSGFQNRVLVTHNSLYEINIAGLTSITQLVSQLDLDIVEEGASQPFNVRDTYGVIGALAVYAYDAATWVSLDGIRFRAEQPIEA